MFVSVSHNVVPKLDNTKSGKENSKIAVQSCVQPTEQKSGRVFPGCLCGLFLEVNANRELQYFRQILKNSKNSKNSKKIPKIPKI